MKITATVTDGVRTLVVDLPTTTLRICSELEEAGFPKQADPVVGGDEPSVSLLSEDKLGRAIIPHLQGIPLNKANWLCDAASTVKKDRIPYLVEWLESHPAGEISPELLDMKLRSFLEHTDPCVMRVDLFASRLEEAGGEPLRIDLPMTDEGVKNLKRILCEDDLDLCSVTGTQPCFRLLDCLEYEKPFTDRNEIAGAVAEQLRRGNSRLLKAFLEAKADALSFDQILGGIRNLDSYALHPFSVHSFYDYGKRLFLQEFPDTPEPILRHINFHDFGMEKAEERSIVVTEEGLFGPNEQDILNALSTENDGEDESPSDGPSLTM